MSYWNGYMDGAVRSKERAAAEVLSALRGVSVYDPASTTKGDAA